MNHPLALILYKRPAQTRDLIEELAKYEPEPLYVFLDGPKNEGEWEAVWKVRQMLRRIDWTKPQVMSRSRNIGLKASIVGAVDHVLERHETVIVLEDDCLPGPWFFDFMGECLDIYARNSLVISVGGYTPPVDVGDYSYDVYFMPRVETWGWATWQRAWKLYERDLGDALRRAADNGVDLEQGGSDVPRYIQEAVDGKDIWSPGWLLACMLNDMVCAYPTEPHIQYVGYDGVGLHCGKAESTASTTQRRSESYPASAYVHIPIADQVKRYYSR